MMGTGIFSPVAKDFARRFVTIALRLCAAFPALVVALLLIGIAGAMAAPSAARTCDGTNLVEALKADGEFDAVERKVAGTPNGEGKFYSVEKPGLARSYLFGTMHLADPRVLTLPSPADEAFASSDRLVIETTDVTDPQKAAAAFFAHPNLINLPAGRTLGDLLDPDQMKRLERQLSESGIPFDAIKTLQPWFTSIGLMMPACETARKAQGDAVLDVALANRAAEAGKAVEGLETAEEQLKALASLPLDLQVDSLMKTLELRDRIPDIFETMISLYVEGKIGAIMPTIEAAVPDGGALVGQGEGFGDFERTVVTERNETMMERLVPYLRSGGTFVAVGALHLPGEEGLVEGLRQRGWTVERLD